MSSQSKVTRDTWILFGIGAALAIAGCVVMGIATWLDSDSNGVGTVWLIGMGIGAVLGFSGLMFCLGACSEAGVGGGVR